MLLLRTMVGDRVAHSRARLRSWALAWPLTAAQMWLHCLRGDMGPGEPSEGQQEAHASAMVQGQPPSPVLATQRWREGAFRKEEPEKLEDERGRKEKGTGSSSSQLGLQSNWL